MSDSHDTPDFNAAAWTPRFVAFLRAQPPAPDGGHGLGHLRRVVATATHLAAAEGARLDVVLPAAWLHDCVAVAKDDPRRRHASQLAADAATTFLRDAGYPTEPLPAIAHAIAAHSFSAGIAPGSLEAKVVQDADRIDALGAIGIARAWLVGGALGLPLAHEDDPFADHRPLDDRAYTLDHYFVKLLRLADTMQTEAGRAEATRRTALMQAYLDQLRAEMTPSKHR
ncbi:MAG: HD domain-containing protein [Bacteroidota bacterium]